MLQKQQFAAIFVLLILQQILVPHVAYAKPEPKKKKAFGAGLLSGALAGVLVSKAFSSNQHNKKAAQPAPAVTTIARGPTLSNGCYQQTVKEPDANNANKFVETVQLICPNQAGPASIPYAPAPAAPSYNAPMYPQLVPFTSVQQSNQQPLQLSAPLYNSGGVQIPTPIHHHSPVAPISQMYKHKYHQQHAPVMTPVYNSNAQTPHHRYLTPVIPSQPIDPQYNASTSQVTPSPQIPYNNTSASYNHQQVPPVTPQIHHTIDFSTPKENITHSNQSATPNISNPIQQTPVEYLATSSPAHNARSNHSQTHHEPITLSPASVKTASHIHTHISQPSKNITDLEEKSDASVLKPNTPKSSISIAQLASIAQNIFNQRNQQSQTSSDTSPVVVDPTPIEHQQSAAPVQDQQQQNQQQTVTPQPMDVMQIVPPNPAPIYTHPTIPMAPVAPIDSPPNETLQPSQTVYVAQTQPQLYQPQQHHLHQHHLQRQHVHQQMQQPVGVATPVNPVNPAIPQVTVVSSKTGYYSKNKKSSAHILRAHLVLMMVIVLLAIILMY